MRLALLRHPDSQGAAVTGVEATISWPAPGRLALAYEVRGAISDLLLPAPALGERTDELWRHTCLEAFVGEAGDPGYYEFNLSPSTQWAAYRFSGYRAAMAAAEIAAPAVGFTAGADACVLTATLALDQLADLSPQADWRLALTAVIEQRDGAKSYWALAHPPGRADFHHEAGFIQLVTPTERA
ncbi:DOMON-like domain-containing protein [Phenylobacterium aquaticum]|uniref:DOMON-like domain-containing protein n=1 Tax=Phenylobacterium aquaticum TaxID=1763816 RepID=UPI001F5E123E|nr:DOMON-like domain-containing protein [Phenylobacterium aquaticum]MCI3135108.1 DOMON-like domain-containing protein [Phenylobacterium aquaticum]